jgi:hypothetical protein
VKKSWKEDGQIVEKNFFGKEKREKIRKTENFEFQQIFPQEFSTWKSKEKRKKRENK